MSRRIVAVAAVLILAAVGADAADPARSREIALPLDETALRAMFDHAPGVIETDAEGLSVEGSMSEVIIARIDGDGNLIKACVATEEEARKFLTAPIEKLDRKEGQHQ